MQVKFKRSDPEKLFFKYNYNDSSYKFTTIDSSKDTRGKRKKKQHTSRYSQPVGITQKKKDALLKLCHGKQNGRYLIPKHKQQFFKDLPVNKAVN